MEEHAVHHRKKQKKMDPLWSGVVMGAATFALLGSISALLISANRAAVFNYFASESVKQLSEQNAEGAGEAARALATQESLVIEAVKKVNPAVISIVVTKDVPTIERYYEQYDPFNDFFGDDFFGGPFGGFQVPRYREGARQPQEIGSGSGFIISKEGLAVTNKHVVDDDKASYTAFTNDGKKHEVEIVANDPVFDVAIIKLKTKREFQYIKFDDSDKLQLGQSVIAIGNALGEFRNTISVGIISGLARSIVAGDEFGRSEQLDEVIQTDAAINPGNSGGPLLNLGGRVIGVNVAVARGSENIGFALPANTVKSIVDTVEKHGKIVRPFLGVRYQMIDQVLKEKNKLPVEDGALVVRGLNPDELAVIPGSPADKAGIVENDIILEVDGVKLEIEKNNLAGIIRRKKVGDMTSLKILHKGEEKKISVKLSEMPD